ncbi:hypothetical protein VULLAG_LOCUS2377 [Vulpes lagopus]
MRTVSRSRSWASGSRGRVHQGSGPRRCPGGPGLLPAGNSAPREAPLSLGRAALVGLLVGDPCLSGPSSQAQRRPEGQQLTPGQQRGAHLCPESCILSSPEPKEYVRRCLVSGTCPQEARGAVLWSRRGDSRLRGIGPRESTAVDAGEAAGGGGRKTGASAGNVVMEKSSPFQKRLCLAQQTVLCPVGTASVPPIPEQGRCPIRVLFPRTSGPREPTHLRSL